MQLTKQINDDSFDVLSLSQYNYAVNILIINANARE